MAASSSTFNRAFAAGFLLHHGLLDMLASCRQTWLKFGMGHTTTFGLKRPALVVCVIVFGAWHQLDKSTGCFAQFSAIPICHGNSASLNQLAHSEFQAAGLRIRPGKGRWYLEANGDSNLEALRDLRHVRSIRRIVWSLDGEVENENDWADWDGFETLESLESLLQDLGRLGANPSFAVVDDKSKLTALLGHDLATKLRQEVAKAFEGKLGWTLTGRGRSPDVLVHVHVDGRMILVEVPILQQNPMMLGGSLPFQGMHHVEAWAIARSLDLQEGEVVLDPMCGQGTLLAEAAIWWPNATFVGCDVNGSQLERCSSNFAALAQKVALHQVDATQPGGIPLKDRSVEKIMVAPPWNRQFPIRGRPQEFYERMLREMLRVIDDKGRIVLFVSKRVLQRVKDALEAVNSMRHSHWSLSEQRSFTVTRKTLGIILILERGAPQAPQEPRHRLFWEGDAPLDGRELYEYWRELRARGFPKLHPVV